MEIYNTSKQSINKAKLVLKPVINFLYTYNSNGINEEYKKSYASLYSSSQNDSYSSKLFGIEVPSARAMNDNETKYSKLTRFFKFVTN